MRNINESSTKAPAKRWWQTNCEKCQRMRMIVVWAVIVFVVYFYVWN